MSSYTPVPPQVDLPALERAVLELWTTEDTFATSLERNAGGQPWTFYEGPPTANGMPGTHHVEARVFKDVFPRFRTMQGYQVDRKAGWDCHGLPVELAVEKELGFSGKGDIEAYGVAEFNAQCRESVLRNVHLFREMTERMGYWVDLDHPYKTMDSSYVESVWWALKQIFDQKLLVEDYRVAPYCPRCGTGLSDHELAQGYETVTDPSVYVRFPLTSGPLAGQAALLVWTTTPWTLVSNTAVAAHPDVAYVAATDGAETLVVAEPLFESVLGEGWMVTQRFTGRDLERWEYARPFDLVDFPTGQPAHFVVLADYVTTEDGTGLVHQAPAFGEEDMQVARAYGLPVVNPVGPDGAFAADVPLVGGQFFKHADTALVADLQERGLLFRHLAYEHSYPHCWRCHTALLYYAQPSWYIRTTARKDELLRENEATNWYPDTIKHGRYGDWLDNNIDWALSRRRYWGTPLPIWRCEDDHQVCVGSLAELSELTGADQSGLDPHRPYVDAVTFACPACGKISTRVPDVIDAWFDSGSMPFAQWGYPYVEGSKERFERAFPADFICEAIDQTRGWFYTLMAVNTLVFDRSSYKNVVCLGHILAEDGRKMSKHLGNILEPIGLMDEHGADAVRWFMACGGSPWAARRVGHQTIQETVRKVLLTYWNVAAFQSLYGRASGFEPDATPAPVFGERTAMDRWVLGEAQRLTQQVTDALEHFDTQRAGTQLAAYVDLLSNWYVRRSRRRFWDGDPAALATLHESLQVVTLLMAPLTPFITERVWQDLFASTSSELPRSVHLAAWPVADEEMIDDQLDTRMRLVRRLVELGRSARAEGKVKTRQPLRRALVPSAAHAALTDELLREIAEELNVGTVEPFSSAGELVAYEAKGNFRSLGKRFGKRTPVVAAAIAAADAAGLAATLADTGVATVDVEGTPTEVTADEVIVSERPREGWSVVNEQGETVALDLALSPELVLAGVARDVVRLVQEARKSSGFEVTDRITLTWAGGAEVTGAMAAHTDLVADEVLATQVVAAEPTGNVFTDDELDLRFSVERR
ncbi:MAG: isoleucine--tRNA ligase [Nocardioidaceae bacterium]